MERLFSSPKQRAVSVPVFGLRYLEEDAAEITDVVGCLSLSSESPNMTYYTSYYMGGCDFADNDNEQIP